MLTNDLISEAEWVAYLEETLTPSRATEASSTIQVEGDRLGLVSPGLVSPGLVSPIAQISPIARPPVAEVVIPSAGLAATPTLRERFREDVIDRSLIAEVSATNLAQSQLAINAKPAWTVSAQQVYRQVPPVPMLDQPVRVGNFLLWPDPQEDSAELRLPDKFAGRLNDRPKKDLSIPILIDERRRGRELTEVVKPVTRPGLAPITRLNSLTVDKSLLSSDQLIQAIEMKQVRVKVRRAFFATVMPELQSLRLTIRQEANSVVMLGRALLTVSLYPDAAANLLEQHRLEWTDALSAAGYGYRLWKFLPVNLQKLQAFLEINPQQLRSPVQVAINASAGTATLLVELSTLGTQIWQQALATRQFDQIAGIARFTADFYARTDDRLQIREQLFSSSLSTFLTNCDAVYLEVIPPTVALTTTLIIQSHALVETVGVTLRPPQSGNIFQDNFAGDRGGTLMGSVMTDNLNTVTVPWEAQIKYRLPSWSIGVQQGTLSLANPTEIVKPGSSEWIQECTMFTVFMQSQTELATDLTLFDDIEVSVSMTLNATNATYLMLPLLTTFQPRHLDVTEVPFPVMPGQVPGKIGIMVVTRSKSQNTVFAAMQRVLPPGELLLNLKVFRGGAIAIQTSTDPIAESSIEGDLLALLGQLKQA
jgi:hypothetical protein